jgi:hypothetical protein
MSASNPLMEHHEKMRQSGRQEKLFSGRDIHINHNFTMHGLYIKNRHSRPVVEKLETIAARERYDEFGFNPNDVPAIIKTILAENPNVILAGGAILNLIYKTHATDWDLFIIGNKSWSTVNEICKRCKHAKLTINRGLINIEYETEPNNVINIQIILRAIPSIHALLHGFDLPHYGVAYDGVRSYFTLLALMALQTNTLFISVKYYSPTFHKRILKYVSRFNYNICFLDLPNTMLFEKINFCLLTLTVDHGYIKSLKYDRGDEPTEGYFIDVLKSCITPQALKSHEFYTHIINRIKITGIEPYIMNSLYYMIRYRPDFNYDLSYRELLTAYGFNLPSLDDCERFYKFMFQCVFKINAPVSARLALKCAFDRDIIKSLIDKKITLRDACKIARTRMFEKLNNPMEYWLIDRPSDQFDMRIMPIEIDPLTAYRFK